MYGWAPYSELLEKYPLTAEYIAENISIRIPIPQMLHNPDTEEPLMWKMHWATPGSTVNSWKIAESNGEFKMFTNNDGSITLKPFPFQPNIGYTCIPFCSNDDGKTWLYTHTIFQQAHPTGLNYNLIKK